MIYQLSDIVDSRFLIPVEAKVQALEIGPVGLSVNGMVPFYIKNKAFGSVNASLGCGFNYAKETESHLRGFFISLYPVYEIPVVKKARGKTPVFVWKSTYELGYGLDIMQTGVYLSFFFRTVLFWKQAAENSGAMPDIGITGGWHFNVSFDTVKSLTNLLFFYLRILRPLLP